MKTELYYKKRAIVERIVMLIENKKQLAESLWITSTQVYRREVDDSNKRPIPKKHWDNIVEYAKDHIFLTTTMFAEQTKHIEEFKSIGD